MARRGMTSWARAGRWRRTRDAYKIQGCLLNAITLFAMVVGVAGCGLAIVATESLLVGFVVGIGIYFFVATRGYDSLTGGE